MVTTVSHYRDRTFSPVLLVLMLFSLASCGGEEQTQEMTTAPQESPQAEGGEQQAQAAKEQEPKAAEEGSPSTDGKVGTISGMVQFTGTPPPPEKLQATKDTEVCGTEKLSHALIVAENGGVQNAVVFLTGGQSGKEMRMPTNNPVLDQKGCEYTPHVLLVPAGATVDIVNSDNILHNIHTHSTKNAAFNRAQPKFQKVLHETFAQPEIIKVTCDVHNWMTAWIVVQDHPYYVKTDTAGTFTLADVPAGDYELKVWHETLGEKTQQVTVRPGEETKIFFTLSSSG